MIDIDKIFKEAILIRKVEEKFLELFSEGQLNGTVHTCVGQEFSAIAFAGQLNKTDSVFSNHRCHGHYISFTKDYYGLIAELMGKEVGTCGGVGSSQHLCKDNFFSNGPQGALFPVSAGVAMSNKLKNNDNIVVVYIGDGTLGEGVIYETMNIVSKWNIPLLIVCENNYYAQSTPLSHNFAGNIEKRAESFGIKTVKSNTWNYLDLIENAKESIDYVRNKSEPVFHVVETYRLKAHSKGDDDREPSEINKYYKKDPIVCFEKENPKIYNKISSKTTKMIDSAIEEIKELDEMFISDYFVNQKLSANKKWSDLKRIEERQVRLINDFFSGCLASNKNTIMLGEDILSPYGGAFKVTEGLSLKYPSQVFGTPISEASIIGLANGLALSGFKPYVEIMFGDFITLCMDQLINNSSKFYHMYNKQVTCPLVIRTPMGGKRGYGPTHSQTLDKFLIGIDNVKVVALNTLIDPRIIYDSVHMEKHPVIVIENKLDYGKKIADFELNNYVLSILNSNYPLIKISPSSIEPTCTIVTYGGTTESVLESIAPLFLEYGILPEIIVLTKIHPIDIDLILDSVKKTKRLYTVEEGSAFGGIGSEIIASVSESHSDTIICKRIASLPVPIPSVRSLEDKVLTNSKRIVKQVGETI